MSMSPEAQSPVEPQNRFDYSPNAVDKLLEVHNDSQKFEIHLDAQQFTPEEIEVKVEGHLLDIHAEHKNRKNPQEARKLDRSYTLPDDVNEHAIRSMLSPRGKLVITAFKKFCTTNPRILLHDNAWIGVAECGVFAHPGPLDRFPVQRSFDGE